MPRIVTLPSVVQHLDALSALLISVVAKGAGVSFLHPLSPDEAGAFWLSLEPDIKSGQTLLFGSFEDDLLVGTVQLKLSWAPNQKHHADISKLLVHPAYQRLGIGTHLIKSLEDKARNLKQKLLTFDASAHGSVEAFYRRLGYNCVGYYPDFALSSLGVMEDTALFFKKL